MEVADLPEGKKIRRDTNRRIGVTAISLYYLGQVCVEFKYI